MLKFPVSRAQPLTSSGGRLQPGYLPNLIGKFALGVPSIVGTLHPHPNTCPVPEQLAEPDGDGRRNRLSLRQDVVKMLTGNTEQRGDLGLALAGRRDHLALHFAGVGRTPVRITFGVKDGHAFAPQ